MPMQTTHSTPVHPVHFVRLTKKDATMLTGGVSNPEKMPCKAWSIPVFMCKRGAQLARVPGSVCWRYYADRGNYAKYRSTIEPAQVARFDAMYADPLAWVEAMVTLIGDDPHFRWFDAGDLQDLTMLELIAQVARRTPRTEHWLPTREYEIVQEYLRHDRNRIPSNMIIRLSAFFPDQPVKVPKALRGVPGIATSEVHTATAPTTDTRPYACPAPTQGNKCQSCRACWSRRTPAVSYHDH